MMSTAEIEAVVGRLYLTIIDLKKQIDAQTVTPPSTQTTTAPTITLASSREA